MTILPPVAFLKPCTTVPSSPSFPFTGLSSVAATDTPALPQLPSRAVTASSSKSHSLSERGAVQGTIMSTAPLAMLVILGGVAKARLRMVGWMENGLTPLLGQLCHCRRSSKLADAEGKRVILSSQARATAELGSQGPADVQDSRCRLGRHVHLDLHSALHRRPRHVSRECSKECVGRVGGRGLVDKAMCVDHIRGMNGGC